MPSQLDPVRGRSISFLFPRCQARLEGSDLVVTVRSPGVTARVARCTNDAAGIAWDAPAPLTGDLTIACDGQGHLRRDRSEYPSEAAYTSLLSFRFQGIISYGRMPYGDGWALHVEGAVKSLSGLPPSADWSNCDAVVVDGPAQAAAHSFAPQQGGAMMMMATRAPSTAASAAPAAGTNDGPVNGPHLPFP